MIYYLPIEIWRLIQEYGPLYALFGTNKYFFSLKRDIYFYYFNRNYSVFYYKDQVFRKLVQSRINISKQLFIDMGGTRHNNKPLVEDTSVLAGVHTLSLFAYRGVKEVSDLGNIHTLNLRVCWNITNVSNLEKVHIIYW